MASLVDITGKSCDGAGSDYWDAGAALIAFATRWPDACALPPGYVRFSPAINCSGTLVEIFKRVDNLASGVGATYESNTIYYSYSYNCGDGGGPLYLSDGSKYFKQQNFSTDSGSLTIYDPLASEASCTPSSWPTVTIGTYAVVRPLLRYVGPTLACTAIQMEQYAYNGFNREQKPLLYMPDGSSIEFSDALSGDGYSRQVYGHTGALTLQSGAYLCPIGAQNSNDAFMNIAAALGVAKFWTDTVGCVENA